MRIYTSKLVVCFFVLCCYIFSASAQTCLQLLDSIELYKSIQREKTIVYGSELMAKLDQGQCNMDLDITAIYNNIGLAFWEAKDQPNARYAFGMSVAHSPTDSLHPDLLDSYYNLSTLSQELGQFDKAEKFLSYADKIVAKAYGYQSVENVSHQFTKGVFYREVGKFNESLTALNAANFIGEDIQMNDSLKVNLMIEIGTTYRHFGDMDAGEEQLLAAIDLAKGSDEILYLTAIDRLSALKIEQGQYSDSENYLLHNLDIKHKSYSHDSLFVLETLNGLGMLYYKINDLESANKYLEDANHLTENMATIKPYMQNNLGTIYMKLGQTEKALEFFTESAEGFRNMFGSMHPDYASSINNLAGAHKSLGDLGEALNLYVKVLDMDKVIYGDQHQRYATTLNNIALVYMQLGSNSLASKLLLEAKEIRAAALGTHHPLYIKSLNDLGLFHLISGDTLRAIESLDAALTSEIQHMRDVFPVLTRQQRQNYFKLAKNNVERFCSIAFTPKFVNTIWGQTGLNHFINTKGILFYASDKMRKLVLSSKDDKIKQTFEDWREKKYQLAQAYLLAEEERQLRGISLRKLENESDELEKRLSLAFAVFSDHEKASYHKWQDISAALPDSTIALDIIHHRQYRAEIIEEQLVQGFEDKSNYTAFIIKPDSVLIPVSWSHSDDLDKNYSLYTNLLKFGLPDTSSYKTFWKPIDLHLSNVRRVYMAPDGIFYKLNPAVFFDTESNTFVSDKYDILNITSSKDLLGRQEKRFLREARIFGNPAFDKLDTDIGLGQLPGAEREANDITKILDVRRWETETYNYLDATEGRVKALDNPGVVHIATHGYFNEDPSFTEPLNSSGLFLSKAEGSDEDGILSAYEAMNLVLDNTSVVVLAACETGLGTIKNGEGVFGLQRAFLVAGANNVLISLVKINDQAARRFMNLYYEQLRLQEDPQEAFFSARSTFKKEETNPYNWGAYVLVSRN